MSKSGDYLRSNLQLVEYLVDMMPRLLEQDRRLEAE